MNTRQYGLMVAILNISLFSCKKEATVESYQLEYKLVTDGAYTTHLQYVNEQGSMVSAPVAEINQDVWIKTLTLTTKPFASHLMIGIDNVSASTFTYTLTISVNGTLKKSQSFSAPPSAIQMGMIDFTVE